ncbi:hypothetical protein AA313_de0208842 [Arthrobotrys entomopaga]|nr:hypothetical protein AA313_de0208842 [Arthrobotrys entomopaga]
MYENPSKNTQETRHSGKKKVRRPSFRDKQEEVEWMCRVAMMSASADFDQFTDRFFTTDFQSNNPGSQYTAFNEVLHPECAKVNLPEWLFHKDHPSTYTVASSSQRFQTNTLTPSGYIQDRFFQRSEDIAHGFPREDMLHEERPHPAHVSRRRKETEEYIEEEREDEEENGTLERDMQRLSIGKQTSRRHRSAKADTKIKKEAPEYKQPRGGIKKLS